MLTVTVTGTGSARVAPDSAVVRLGAVARGAGVTEAFEAMTAHATTVVGVAFRHTDESRIASTGISVWPFHDHEGRREGFEARRSYAIGCADLGEAGEMLRELALEVGDGLVIDSVGWEATQDHGAGGKAREAAFQDARERAASLARMAGAGLGKVQSMVEGEAAAGAAPLAKAMVGAGGGLESGETTVTVAVTVVWELAYPNLTADQGARRPVRR